MEVETDTVDLQTREILLAAAHHDVPRLRALLRNTPASVQDEETGYTPLHAAIAACEPENETKQVPNGTEVTVSPEQQEDLAAAETTLKILFQNGAIWNDLSANNETPGCIAYRLGLKSLYEMMVDAGVRAELLMNRLDDYEPLDDGVDDDEEEEENEDAEAVIELDGAERNVVVEIGVPTIEVTGTTDESTESANYLESTLEFQDDRLLDDSRNGVMMNWETEIMRRTTEYLLPTSNLAILNIGHGMGIFDTFAQEKLPSTHHIIEAHPQVLQKMRQHSWYDKPNVTIHEGKWQDMLPKLVEQGFVFDAIYFDTFAEDYKAFRHFFNEHVIKLLTSDGLWSFFHGLGADRQVCYDVYTKVVEMDVFEAGFDIEWENVDVPNLAQSDEWQGVRRAYWALDTYRLPICKFVS